MKNIHVLPADKPSNGYILGKCIKELSDVKIGQLVKTYYLMFDEEYFKPQNIYITSDEEIKEGDWCLNEDDFDKHLLFKADSLFFDTGLEAKKIILTTDQDLIKDGVQAIDDEFLEWFVKNTTCERVEVEYNEYEMFGNKSKKWIDSHNCYEIIIPEEEPKQELEEYTSQDFLNEVCWNNFKQETLEEACERLVQDYNGDISQKLIAKTFMSIGAKWQAEQDKQEIQDLRSRLDFVHESSTKAIELIEALQSQTEGMYNEDIIRQVLSKLTLINPVHLEMTSNGHGEFPDGYKLTEKGIDCIVEQLKK